MALTLIDLISFNTAYACRLMEVEASGSAFTIDTSWVPPNSCAKSAYLAQSKDYSYVRSYPIAFDVAAASFNYVSFLLYITQGWPDEGWPPVNDIPLIVVKDSSTGSHWTLNITDNGDGNDRLELKTALLAATADSAVGVLQPLTVYQIDIMFELDNSADAYVWVTEWGTPFGSPVLSATGADFWSGSGGDLEIQVQGQGGLTPTYALGVHVSTLACFNGAVDISEFPAHHFDIIMGSTDDTDATPDASAAGVVGGGTNLHVDTWDKIASDSIADYCAYCDVAGPAGPAGGTVDCPEPAASLGNQDYIYGASWCAKTISIGGGANMNLIWGWHTGEDPYAEINSLPVSGSIYSRIIRDRSSAECPGPNAQFVFGMEWTAATYGSRYCRFNEAFGACLVRYPLLGDHATEASLGQGLNIDRTSGSQADRVDWMLTG